MSAKHPLALQELKAIKLAQKDGTRNLTQLQVNMTAVLGKLALEMDLLTHRMDRIDPPVQALLPAGGEGGVGFPSPMVRGQKCSAREGEGLDFREAGQCQNPEAMPSVQVSEHGAVCLVGVGIGGQERRGHCQHL
jgi:hypothetical protein